MGSLKNKSISGKIILLLLLMVGKTIVGNTQSTYWQQQVNFDIQVSLDDHKNTFDGFEKITYFNNSPDTLTYIWFHVWMNAYKNDKTAFSDQKLGNGSTDFYFAEESKRGYTGKLNFRVDNEKVLAETHPKYIDIIKVQLKKPLPPHQSIEITTPFHVKLPYNFSRGGHVGKDYQITQWYPKPAVYDTKGWHPMPYLDQGEFYSEFGNYHVEITVPETYVVASSGELKNAALLDSIKAVGKTDPAKQIHFNQAPNTAKTPTTKQVVTGTGRHKKVTIVPVTPVEEIVATVNNRTWVYEMNNVHDFAWFASKEFAIQYDTLQLPSKTVDVFTYCPPKEVGNWNKSIAYAKDGLRKYSQWLGDYPYSTASVVCGAANVPSGGMEYPSITLITTNGGGKNLDEVIAHELGHNWFYGALASNERDHPWMDEGMNTYYQKRYTDAKYKSNKEIMPSFFSKRWPDDLEKLLTESMIGIQKDQPIESVSDSFSEINYGAIVYEKTALWMKRLEQHIGTTNFDAAMHSYYKSWQNKHPYPEDFKQCFEASIGNNIDSLYHQLSVRGSLEPATRKKTKLIGLFSLKNTNTTNYVSVVPVLGYNYYDKWMPGIGFHNYTLPINKLQFFGAAMYGTGSNELHGIGRVSYNIYHPRNNYQFAVSYADFNMGKQLSSINGIHYYAADKNIFFTKATRIVPSFHWTLYDKDARSSERWNILLRTFLITEEQHNYYSIDSVTTGLTKHNESYYVNQLSITWSNYRKLYPFDLNLQIDQGNGFVRAGLTGNYFFNYANEKQGIHARFFAGKFFYTVSKTYLTQYQTDRFHLNMTGANGNEDYTYSDYFIGRNSFQGWTSQQIMERDGFFKMRTDLQSSKVGKTDDWLIAANFEGKIPDNINPMKLLPFKFPLHFFVDFGSYADAWKDNSGTTERFLYDAGLYLPLMNGLAKIYVPILYSNVFSDYNKTVLGSNSFWKTVSFSMNLGLLKPQKMYSQFPL